MNYETHYNTLNERARNRVLKGYTERHHVVPRCMGGSDDAENIVRLTAEEHYVAHQLLVKIYPGHRGLAYAAICMTMNPQGQRSNNKLYGWLRKSYAKSQIGIPSPKKNNTNSMKGKTKAQILGLEKAAQLSAHLSKIQQGRTPWNKGKKGVQIAWNKGILRTNKQKQHQSKVMLGRISVLKGKTYEEIYGTELAAKKKNIEPSNKSQKGIFGWFTNEKENKFCKLNEAPPEWRRGMCPIKELS